MLNDIVSVQHKIVVPVQGDMVPVQAHVHRMIYMDSAGCHMLPFHIVVPVLHTRVVVVDVGLCKMTGV